MKEIKRIISLKGFIVNLNKTASMDVDAECCFSELCPEELPVEGALEIVPELNKQADCVKFRVGSKDAHAFRVPWATDAEHPQLSPITGYKDLDVYWNIHGVPGTKGFEFLPGLDPEAYDFIAYKGIEPTMHPYGACFHDLADTKSTGLIEYLQVNDVQAIIVGGLATSFCLKKTVLQLCQHSHLLVFVNLAACRDLSGVDTIASIQEMEEAGAMMLENADEIINAPETRRFQKN